MKEYPERTFGEKGQERLTTKPRNLTLRSEGTSMAEKQEQPQKPESRPQKPELKKPQDLVSKPSQDQVTEWAAGFAKEQGLDWDKLELPVRGAFIEHAREFGRPGPGAMAAPPTEEEERLRAAGWIDGGETPPPPDVPPIPPGGDDDREVGPEFIRRDKLILKNSEFREDYFNQLFSTTYAYPDRAFNEIFSPFYGHGRQYDDFMNLIQQASVGRFGLFERDPDFTPEEKARIQRELEDDLTRYQKERAVIQAIHDASRVLFYPSVDAKSYLEAIGQFDSKGGDVAFRTPGVNQMMNIIENVLRETMMRNDGSLPPEAVSGKVETEEKTVEGEVVKVVKKVTRGEVEMEVKKRFREWASKQLVVSRGESGKAHATPELRAPKDWEVERIFSMARGMMLIDGRLVSIMAESTQPENTAQYASQFLQDILQSWSSFQHLTGKYGLTKNDMALLLFNDKKIEKLLGLSIWNPNDLKEVLDRYNADPRSVLEDTLSADPNELFYIMRENPFRAGDIFTWISWRLNPGLKAGKEEAVESMIKDFMDKGRTRMQRRLDERGGTPPAGLSEEDYLREYKNWVGTGIRFEKLRGKMADGDRASLEKGKDILKRMSKLQGYRFYSLSKYVRDRINESGALSAYSTEQINRALEDLSLAEAALLKDRENILDRGDTFDNVSLSDYYDVIPEDENRRTVAQALAEEIMADFRSDPEKYYDEFIYKREYRHGFVLWSGDSPIDEFNFSRLAPTGGFARRARDNSHQAEASTKVLKFMSSLKHINNINDIFKPLAEIHEEIALYDSAKADLAMMELAQGIVRFYSERSTTKIPIYGQLERLFGEDISFAKLVHGKGAMAWSAAQSETFIDQLENLNYITKEQAKAIREKGPVGRLDFAVDVGVTLSQLIMLWLLGYLAERIYKEK